MAFLRKQLTEISIPLPTQLDDEPGKELMMWSARALTSGEERALGETVLRLNWHSVASTNLLQAWFSYVDSTFVWKEKGKKPVRIFPVRDGLDLNGFIASWDELDNNIIAWIMERVVWVVNPHWRPFDWVDMSPPTVDDDDDDSEKKMT